ncbi:hypothetical protein BKA70DRAFT_382403 [Coprinopsis sp. MPI-PUGE-AT-0042]|nr:hypothetical protein BKA70DRAFT_382403 [Coprinopsis sp. MPI-PUGE-AT-0042]
MTFLLRYLCLMLTTLTITPLPLYPHITLSARIAVPSGFLSSISSHLPPSLSQPHCMYRNSLDLRITLVVYPYPFSLVTIHNAITFMAISLDMTSFTSGVV